MSSQPTAYSYIRFSHPLQAQGDSLRRQTQAAAEWCSRNGVCLDDSVTLHDLGRSAFTGSHRVNPDRNALAGFLRLVEQGRVPRGSFLVCENLDRLSREHIQPALLLVLNLLQAGVRVVQLRPSEVVFDSRSDTLPVMLMMLELSRGHGESEVKSQRIGAAWAEKRERARRGGILTRRLPAWVGLEGGKLVLIPEAARAVRQAFRLSAAGHGIPSIIARFAAEGVAPIGRRGVWTRSYLGLVLKDRRALGELQLKRRGEPDGPPLRDYFPAAVTEQEFHAARAGAAERLTRRGRTSAAQVNVFSGLLVNARDGENYFMTQRLSKCAGRPARRFQVLVNAGSDEGRSRAYSLPYLPFEEAVLSLIREVSPAEVLGTGAEPDASQALAGELAGVEAKIGELESELEQGDVAALARVLRQLEARKADLARRLAEAQQRAASPLSAAWGEAQSLASALESAPDPRGARLRLRSALRRVVASARLLVVPRPPERLAALQVLFQGGGCRSYLILLRPARNNGTVSAPARWWARSLTGGPPLDLADPAHAAALAARLEALDLASLRGER